MTGRYFVEKRLHSEKGTKGRHFPYKHFLENYRECKQFLKIEVM
jgi:hypothetical protein